MITPVRLLWAAHVCLSYYSYLMYTVICIGNRGGGQIRKNIFRAFFGKYHVKLGSFVNFSGKYNVKFGHFVNFSYTSFRAKMSSPES